MRDAKRIPDILKRIERVWLRNPDLRLAQLIGNAAPHGDAYYIEDEKLIHLIESQNGGQDHGSSRRH